MEREIFENDRRNEKPLPWIYPILLGIAFNGDVMIKGLFYLPTKVVLPVTVVKLGAMFALAGLLVLRCPRFAESKTVVRLRMLLIAYAVVGFYVSFFFGGEVDPFALKKAGAVILLATLGIWTMSRTLETGADLRRFGIVILVFALWVCFTTMAEVSRGNLAVLVIGADEQQFGIFGMPIAVRMGIGFRVAPMVLMPLLLIPKKKRGFIARFASPASKVALPILIFLTVLVAGHRAGLAAMAAAIAYRQLKRFRIAEMALLGIAVIVLSVILANLSRDFNNVLERASTLFTMQRKMDSSIRGRTQLYDIALTAFSEHPIVGTGFGGFRRYVGDRHNSGIYPHNVFLEYMSDAGIVGLIVAMAIFFAFFKVLHRARDDLALPFAGMILMFALMAQFSGDFIGLNNFYMLIGMIPVMERLELPCEATAEEIPATALPSGAG